MSKPINKFWTVVAFHEDGSLTSPPAQKHDTEEKATSEALRLASSITTTAFLVMEPVRGFCTARPAAMPVTILPPAPAASPEPEDIIDYMEVKAAASTPADGWIEWRGGLCPVGPSVHVEVRFADGLTNHNHGNAAGFSWARMGGPGDIVAYRVVRP